jgi:hypothetical protein
MRVDVEGYLAMEVFECPLLTGLNSTRTARPVVVVVMMIPAMSACAF